MRHVLALNAGSSSLKFGLYRVAGDACAAVFSGEAKAIGAADGSFAASAADGRTLVDERIAFPTQRDAALRLFDLVAHADVPPPDAVGHRIVHGGPDCVRHARITEPVLASLRQAAELAPLHVPAALAIVDAARERFPGLPQIACLDTDFHADLPDAARRFPLPQDSIGPTVRRYGFHGLSCESIVRQLGDALPARLVVAHLGSGASVTAILNGKSVDTSMGLTPTGGIVMATRPGDLDPGLLIYLLRHGGFDVDRLEAMLERRSGLAGISGGDGDMRHLHEAAPRDQAAARAVEMFCLSARKQIAAMAAVLVGIDRLVFTGGIGENDALVRGRICEGLAWIPGLGGAVQILPSREDEQIALHTAALADG